MIRSTTSPLLASALATVGWLSQAAAQPPVPPAPPTPTPTPMGTPPASLPAPGVGAPGVEAKQPASAPTAQLPAPAAPTLQMPAPPTMPYTPGCYGNGPAVPEMPCISGPCRSPIAYLYGDFLYWKRDVDREKLLIGFQAPGLVGTSVLSEDAFDYDSAFRITYGSAMTEVSACDTFLEGSFLGFHHANTGVVNVAAPPVTLFGGQFSPLFDVVNSQQVDYVSDLHSAEVNFKRDYFVDRTLMLLAGFRYIRFDDRFTVTESGTVTRNGVAGLPATALRKMRVIDNLVGLQVGFEWNTNDPTSRWQLGAFGKAGVYANLMEGQFDYFTTDGFLGPVASSANPGRTKMSGVVEAGLLATCQLAPQLYFRGGYQFLWLGHIAVAPDQLPPDPYTGAYNGKISTNGDVFFHGPFAGLEWRWGCCR